MTRKIHSREIITKIFGKANKINSKDPNLWRRDRFNNLIYRPAYGDFYSEYGWDIHHKNDNPNDNNINNLEALHYDSHRKIHNT